MTGFREPHCNLSSMCVSCRLKTLGLPSVQFDVNKDGYISLSELMIAMRAVETKELKP